MIIRFLANNDPKNSLFNDKYVDPTRPAGREWKGASLIFFLMQLPIIIKDDILLLKPLFLLPYHPSLLVGTVSRLQARGAGGGSC